jgi:hypothetical protein
MKGHSDQKVWSADIQFVLLHENECLYIAAFTLELLQHLNWELSDHPSYSPDAVLSNYHLFT